jgi:hypothetical protein
MYLQVSGLNFLPLSRNWGKKKEHLVDKKIKFNYIYNHMYIYTHIYIYERKEKKSHTHLFCWVLDLKVLLPTSAMCVVLSVLSVLWTLSLMHVTALGLTGQYFHSLARLLWAEVLSTTHHSQAAYGFHEEQQRAISLVSWLSTGNRCFHVPNIFIMYTGTPQHSPTLIQWL